VPSRLSSVLHFGMPHPLQRTAHPQYVTCTLPMARLEGRLCLLCIISSALFTATAAERDSAASRAASASKVREDLLAAVVTAPGPMFKQSLKPHTAKEAPERLTQALDADDSDIDSLLAAALPLARSSSSAVAGHGAEVSSAEKVNGLMRVAELAEQKAALVEASLAEVESRGEGGEDSSKPALAHRVKQLTNVAKVARTKAKETEQSVALDQLAAKAKKNEQEEEIPGLQQVLAAAIAPPKVAVGADLAEPPSDAGAQPNFAEQVNKAFPQMFMADTEDRAVLPHTQQEIEQALQEGRSLDERGLLLETQGKRTVVHQKSASHHAKAHSDSDEDEDGTGDSDESGDNESETTGTQRRRSGVPEPEHSAPVGRAPEVPEAPPLGRAPEVPEAPPLGSAPEVPEAPPMVQAEQEVHEKETNEMRLRAALENKTMRATDALKTLESQDQKLKEMVTAAEDVAAEKARIAMEMAKLEIQQHKRQADTRLVKVQDAVLGRIKAIKPAPLPEIQPECLEPQVQNITDETLVAWKRVTAISSDLEAALRELSLLEARLASEQGKVSILKARELTKQVEKEASVEVEQYMHTWSRKLARTQETIHEELNRTMMSMNKRMGCDRGTPLDYGGFWHGSIKLTDGGEAKEFLFTISPVGEGDSGSVTWSAPDLFDADRSIPYTVCECGQIEMKVKGTDEMLIGKLVSKDKLVWSDHTMWERRSVVLPKEKVVEEESPGPSHTPNAFANGQGTRWLSVLLLSAAISYF